MNVIARWQRHRELTPAEAARVLRDALQLPFAVVEEGSADGIVEAALSHDLSAYDATYLRLAMVTGEPLATLDTSLIRATSAVGVECV